MSIGDFATVTIAAEGPPLTAVGFGTLGLAAYFDPSIFDAYSKVYASTTDAGEDFLSDSAVYKMVQRAFQQNPRLQQVKVLRLEHPVTCTYDVVPIAADATTYSITVEVERPFDADPDTAPLIKHTVSFTSGGSATVDEICDGLKTALDGVFDAGDLTVTPDGGTATKLTLTTTGTGRMLWVEGVDPRRLKVTDTTADASASADLDAVDAADTDWYGLCTACNSVAFATVVAGWVNAKTKIYATQTSDWAAANDGASTTDLQPALHAVGYDRTIVGADLDTTAGYYGCAAFGERFPFDPGTGPDAGGTLNAKQIKGVSADGWTPAQKAVLTVTKGYAIVENTAGVVHTLGGRAANGTPIDQTRFLDWFGIRLQEKIATAQLNNGKIGFDKRGLGILEGICRAQVAEGIAAGGIAARDANGNEPVVFVPALSQTSSTDRGNRVLNGVQISFEYTGAIEHVNVQVTVTL